MRLKMLINRLACGLCRHKGNDIILTFLYYGDSVRSDKSCADYAIYVEFEFILFCYSFHYEK